jgi:hypothetical protein
MHQTTRHAILLSHGQRPLATKMQVKPLSASHKHGIVQLFGNFFCAQYVHKYLALKVLSNDNRSELKSINKPRSKLFSIHAKIFIENCADLRGMDRIEGKRSLTDG